MTAEPISDASRPELGSTIVRHIEFDRAYDAVMESIEDPAGTPIVLGIGIAGFGKTELGRLVEETVAGEQEAAMLADPNLVPVVRFEAFAPDNGRDFAWRQTLFSLTGLLGDRGVEHRIGEGGDLAVLTRPPVGSSRSRSNPELLLDVIDAIRVHGTRVLIIDEIEHVAYARDEMRFEASLDTLKTIANETGVRIVALGSYEGAGFARVSMQLARRTRVVHLARYRADDAREYGEYGRVVRAMLELIGYEDGSEELIPVLYRQSLGAVGTTADLLVRAERAWRRHSGSLLLAVGRNARSADDLEVIAKRIATDEALFRPTPDATVRFDKLIGLAATAPIPSRRSPAKTMPKPKRRVGRRAPVRDIVGSTKAA